MFHLNVLQIFMGWLWFIPTFHMPHPRSSSQAPTKFVLTRKDIDFPWGVGAGIIDVEISLEWYSETDLHSLMEYPT
jgi:phosphatidylinositol-3,4,5-trisphosphate 3-phosphatase/dual-specificity protein phosphatase PTEN